MNTRNSTSTFTLRFMLAVGIPAVVLTSLVLGVAHGQSRSPEVISEREDGTGVLLERIGDIWTITDLVNGTPVSTRQASPGDSTVLDARATRIDREQRTGELLAVLESLRSDIDSGRSLSNSEIVSALDVLAEWVLLNGG